MPSLCCLMINAPRKINDMASKGLMSPCSCDDMEEDAVHVVPLKEAIKNRDRVIKDWHLGPEKASPKATDNKPYWVMMAKVWGDTESVARRKLCANCEYFDNTPEAMQAMDVYPFDKFDADGGGRGYCHKFDFACHNLRTCQAWERKDYELEE